jgi:hypothetical protein
VVFAAARTASKDSCNSFLPDGVAVLSLSASSTPGPARPPSRSSGSSRADADAPHLPAAAKSASWFAQAGSTTVRQLAAALLAEDGSQPVYYEYRMKEMHLPVLRRHSIVSSDRDPAS